MPVRFNESYTIRRPPKNARAFPATTKVDDEANANLGRVVDLSKSDNLEAKSTQLHPTTPIANTDKASPSASSSSLQLNAHCAKCKHPFGKLYNTFEKTGGLYYLYPCDTSRCSLRPEGQEAPAKSEELKELDNCLVQELICWVCAGHLGYRCVSAAADKSSFQNRTFFKSGRFYLVKPSTGKVEVPIVVKLASSNKRKNATLAHPEPDSSSSASTSAMPSFEHPDYEAARGILNGDSWSDAHIRWEGRTGEQLSPNAFGKRIEPIIYELQEPKPADRKEHRSAASHDSHDSLSVRTLPNGNSSQPNGMVVNRARIPDSLEAQRADISRIDAVVGSLQTEVSQMRGLLNEVRHELRTHESRRSSGTGDTTLDSLSETVGRMAARTGEVDGLRFELTALKGKMRRMEEASGIPTTPAQPNASFPRSETSAPIQRVPSQQQHQEIAPRGWNAVNAGKRKSFDAETPTFQDPNKRPRSEYRPPSGESNPSYNAQPSSTSTIAPPQSQPQPPPPVLAPIRSNSQESSWHPDSHRLPPLRGMHQSGRGRPPRLAQTPSQEINAAEWDKESWGTDERVGADGYYRPLAGAPPGGPISPGASKRGGMIRRGTAGGPLQYIDPPAKRTRQRPVRNEHGVLIRKDGKPDQRSISSPQNLRKVHERRMAEQEKGSQGSPDSPSSPADLDGRDEFASGDSAAASSQSGTPPIDHPARHERVMSRMFPDGVASDADGLHRVAHAYHAERYAPAHSSDEIIKGELREKQNHVVPDSMDVDGITTTGTEEDASGSVYEPSQTQHDQGKGEPVRDEDSDNRPLRPRHRDVERVQEQASGSVYQPSEESSAA